MPVYTPPALNAVNAALVAYTPPSLTPATQALSVYSPPALSAVNFALVVYVAPTYPSVGWELLPTSSFPTQYQGLRIWHSGAMVELCLVATADALTGMGGQPRVRKGGTTYAMYLVETTDADASPFRIETSAGTKSVRLKT